MYALLDLWDFQIFNSWNPNFILILCFIHAHSVDTIFSIFLLLQIFSITLSLLYSYLLFNYLQMGSFQNLPFSEIVLNWITCLIPLFNFNGRRRFQFRVDSHLDNCSCLLHYRSHFPYC